MKKIIIVLLVLFTAATLWAGWDLGLSLDLGTVQDLLISKGSYQFNMDVRASVDEKFELRIPVVFTFKNSDNFLETGLDVVYYPYGNGLFMGLSVFDFGSKVGKQIVSIESLSEMLVGWNFEFPFGMYLEPSLVIRNPGDTYASEYKNLLGRFASYSTFRFRAIFGWKIIKG